MKLLLLPLVLLSGVALAQKSPRTADSYRYAPAAPIDHSLDSLPAWSEYRARYYQVNNCYCPMVEKPAVDPRHGPSPYQYLPMDKPIRFDTQGDSLWRKADQDFIQDFQRAVQGVDSLFRIPKPKPRPVPLP